MPWKEESVMSQRLKLIQQMLLPNAHIRALCQTYQVSPKTAYKWLKRYQENGIQGLCNQSRQPITQPKKISKNIERVIINVHKEFPYWGPYKLEAYMANEHILKQVPSHKTIAKVIKRNGYEVIKNNKSKPATKRFERELPNDLWQIDFKGSFMTKSKRCYPLTILDDHSRFSIALEACSDEKCLTVQDCLTRVFEEYGLPKQINADNGNPWGASDLESLTSLHVWLMKKDIRLSHSAPYHPQTNGKDERFHRSLKLEVLHQKQYDHLADSQQAFDHWRDIYNFKRPHQGIGNKTPSTRYISSKRKLQCTIKDYSYETNEEVRKVRNKKPYFYFKGKTYKAGRALMGEYIALKETDSSAVFAIFFRDYFIKQFHLDDFL